MNREEAFKARFPRADWSDAKILRAGYDAGYDAALALAADLEKALETMFVLVGFLPDPDAMGEGTMKQARKALDAYRAATQQEARS